MSSALTPNVCALSRSMETRTSGLLNFRSLSTNENTGLLRASSTNLGKASRNASKSNACTTNCTPVLVERRSPILASCVILIRAPVNSRCSERRSSAISDCVARARSVFWKSAQSHCSRHLECRARRLRPGNCVNHLPLGHTILVALLRSI